MSLYASSPSITARHAVLRLYKDCLKSALAIPDPSQRAMYIQYTREGFHNNRHTVPESLEATRAIRDAQEQMERMNYYHSIRERKAKGEEYPPGLNGNTASAAEEPKATTILTPSLNGETTASSTNRLLVVESWLLTVLPDLHPDDCATYSQQLLKDGFDSPELLRMDLMPEDLHFMKKAHQRALVRAYQLQ